MLINVSITYSCTEIYIYTIYTYTYKIIFMCMHCIYIRVCTQAHTHTYAYTQEFENIHQTIIPKQVRNGNTTLHKEINFSG
jgi:hypothetical protein